MNLRNKKYAYCIKFNTPDGKERFYGQGASMNRKPPYDRTLMTIDRAKIELENIKLPDSAFYFNNPKILRVKLI